MSTRLDPKIIKKVSEQVYKKFPEVSGSKPVVKNHSGGKGNSATNKSSHETSNYLLTFRGSVEIGNGKRMDRWVRVVVNNLGNIKKITTSR